MREKFQQILMKNAKVLNQDRQHIERAIGSQRGKIVGKLKHNYNAFKELRTKIFRKQCVIWSFSPSLNEFHHKLNIFKNSAKVWNN